MDNPADNPKRESEQESNTAEQLRADAFGVLANKYFDEFDKNHDGKLTTAELESAEQKEQLSPREMVRNALLIHSYGLTWLPPNGIQHLFGRGITRERLREFQKLQESSPEHQLVKDVEFSTNKTRREQLTDISEFIRAELKPQHPRGIFAEPEVGADLLARIAADPGSSEKKRAIATFLQDNLKTFANLATFGLPPHHTYERTQFNSIRYRNLDQLNDVITFHQRSVPARAVDQPQDPAPLKQPRSEWHTREAVRQLQQIKWPQKSFK